MSLPSPITTSTLANGYVNAASFFFKIWTVINALIAWASGLTSVPTWYAVPGAAGWTNLGGSFFTCQYTKNKIGLVTLRGIAQNTSGGSLGPGAILATLPAGYRPAAHLGYSKLTSAALADRVDIDASGNIIATSLMGNNYIVSLDCIQFFAA